MITGSRGRKVIGVQYSFLESSKVIDKKSKHCDVRFADSRILNGLRFRYTTAGANKKTAATGVHPSKIVKKNSVSAAAAKTPML